MERDQSQRGFPHIRCIWFKHHFGHCWWSWLLTAGSAVGYTPRAYSVTTAGDAFSYSESFIEGDATPSNTTVTSGVVGSLPMLGSTTTTSGGVAGNLAGSIATDGALTITAGGAGTSAIGQVIQELTVD